MMAAQVGALWIASQRRQLDPIMPSPFRRDAPLKVSILEYVTWRRATAGADPLSWCFVQTRERGAA